MYWWFQMNNNNLGRSHPQAQLYGLRKQLNDAQLKSRDQQNLVPSQMIVSGQFLVNAAGEARVDVVFPVKFTDKPLVVFGFEMKDGDFYIPGRMAQPTGIVLAWNTEDRPPISRQYVGCTIGVVSTGPSYQKLMGTWQATGPAFTDSRGR
jgi:hypothetical protein